MRIHSIIHAPFEKLGVIEDWVSEKNYQLSVSHGYKGEKLPDTSQFDFLIVMGGPQSACELTKYAYLQNEIVLAKQAIEKNKAVLGICLGAQLVAEALGAKTTRSPNKEIGVYPIQTTKAAMSDALFQQFPPQFDVMHWHNDMPGIPEGAVLLAKSEGCPQQAFAYGDRVYGFQFHLEMTPALVKALVEHCPEDLLQGKYIRNAKELLSANLESINQKMYLTLDHLAKQVSV